MAILTCEKLCISYNKRQIIVDLDLTLQKGDYLCITGDNGTGKSTLIRSLLGIKAPKSGRVTFGEGVRASEIGYLPQKTELQSDFPASVLEVVLSGRLNRHPIFPFYTREDRAAAEENLKRLSVLELKNRSFSELSGGQQQRVLLARALCAAKKLILLDEPVAGLDRDTASELYALIKEINEGGITVIMVTHDLAPAFYSATKILHLGKSGYHICTPERFREEISEGGTV